MTPHEIAEELQNLRNQMQDLIQQAEQYLREPAARHVRASAEAYWIPHLKSALGSQAYHTYSTTMESTIHVLEEDDHEA